MSYIDIIKGYNSLIDSEPGQVGLLDTIFRGLPIETHNRKRGSRHFARHETIYRTNEKYNNGWKIVRLQIELDPSAPEEEHDEQVGQILKRVFRGEPKDAKVMASTTLALGDSSHSTLAWRQPHEKSVHFFDSAGPMSIPIKGITQESKGIIQHPSNESCEAWTVAKAIELISGKPFNYHQHSREERNLAEDKGEDKSFLENEQKLVDYLKDELFPSVDEQDISSKMAKLNLGGTLSNKYRPLF